MRAVVRQDITTGASQLQELGMSLSGWLDTFGDRIRDIKIVETLFPERGGGPLSAKVVRTVVVLYEEETVKTSTH